MIELPQLVIAEWAEGLHANLLSAHKKMAGTPAQGRPLVTNGALGVDLIRLRAGDCFAPHTHPGDHVLIVVGGRGTITYDRCVHPTRCGQVYLVPGAVPHAVGAVTDHAILAVGAPHRAVDDPGRMELVDYAAVATTFGELKCLACRPAAMVRPGDCEHVPVSWGA